MKIILNRDVAIGGRHYAAGETVDVGDADAISLINMGKAQPKAKASPMRRAMRVMCLRFIVLGI